MGRLEGVLLARRLGVPAEAIRYAVADKVSACVGSDGGKPSACAWVDVLRLEFAQVVAESGLQEVFTPAQHDTGWEGPLAAWQACCDTLAKGTGEPAATLCRPCPELLRDTALYYLHGRLVLSLPATLDSVYERMAAGRLHAACMRGPAPLS